MNNPNDLMRVTTTYRYDGDANHDTTTIVSCQNLLVMLESHIFDIYEGGLDGLKHEGGLDGLKPRPTAEQVLIEAQIDGWHSQLPDRVYHESYHIFVDPLKLWQPAP